jgi:hypothetical protein
MAERFKVSRRALALYTRFEQAAGPRLLAEDGGEPTPTGRDQAGGYGSVVRHDRELTLAFVQIQGDDLHVGRFLGRAPRRETVSA